jgi:glycerol uptake facilitator protein
MRSKLTGEMAAEAIGSFILVFFGTGSVAVAVLTGALDGLWQVASVWGFGIALAIYAVGAVSGAHINPAVTVAMAIFRRREFPARKIAPYIGAQMVGGILASVVLLGLFGGTCRHFERTHEPPIVRGEPGSQLSAMWFGEYFPNPDIYGTDADAWAQVGPGAAFAGEAIGTAFLVFFILALTDRVNTLAPTGPNLHPFFIGFTVAAIIGVVAPLTMAGLNPMRDFAPRLVAYFAGWGEIAIPGPRGVEWWLYIVAPLVGGIAGGAVYHYLLQPWQHDEHVASAEEQDEAPVA